MYHKCDYKILPNKSFCNEVSHSIKHTVRYSVIDFIVEIKLITTPVTNPAKIFANIDDRKVLVFIYITEHIHAIIERINSIPNTQI